MNQNLVLIAEDDRDIRDMLAHALETAGYQSVGARDGHTAAHIMAVAKPVAVIADVRLPGMNGMELCRHARRNPAIRDTAIIMVSSNAHDYDIAAGLEAGADRYLPKPVQPRHLVAAVQEIVTNRVPTAAETGNAAAPV